MMQREIYAGCIYPLSSALYISCMGHINYACSFCNMMRRVLHYVVLNVRWLLAYFIVPFKSLKCDRKIIIRNSIDILKICHDLKYMTVRLAQNRQNHICLYIHLYNYGLYADVQLGQKKHHTFKEYLQIMGDTHSKEFTCAPNIVFSYTILTRSCVFLIICKTNKKSQVVYQYGTTYKQKIKYTHTSFL